MKRIETERLILRPMTVEDAEQVFVWCSDPEVNHFMPYPLYTDVEKVREWIASIKEESNEFGFELKKTGILIGSGSISPSREEGVYEFGYNLRRDYWGKGYATEAAKAMIAWAHDTLGIKEFSATHALANTASGNVIRKCGLTLYKYTTYEKFDGSRTFEAADYRMRIE